MILLLCRCRDGAVLFKVRFSPAFDPSGFEVTLVGFNRLWFVLEVLGVEIAEGQVDIGIIRIYGQRLPHGLLRFRKLTAALKHEPQRVRRVWIIWSIFHGRSSGR